MAEYDYPGSSPTFGVTLNSGDVMPIFPNGGASGVTINSGGTQYVEGGYSGSDTINSGGVQQIDSGNVDGSNIESGGVTYVNGGSVGLPTDQLNRAPRRHDRLKSTGLYRRPAHRPHPADAQFG